MVKRYTGKTAGRLFEQSPFEPCREPGSRFKAPMRERVLDARDDTGLPPESTGIESEFVAYDPRCLVVFAPKAFTVGFCG